MPYEITNVDVTNGFNTSVPTSEIDLLISVVDNSDECLTANDVADDEGRVLKIYAVRHMLVLSANSGSGTVRSQTAPSGASQSYGGWKQGEGLNSSPYGNLLKQLDVYGCVTKLLENDANLLMWSVGS